MVEWRDIGFVLSARPHGENSAIVDVFTPTQGRHSGVVRGGAGRKLAPVLQAGSQVDVVWRARLPDHMGAFTVEPIRSRTATALSGRLALAGLNAVCALLQFSLAERDPHPEFYLRSEQLLDLLGHDDIWPLAYLQWEMALLEEAGFGLDLDRCAVTGTCDDLVYVSPKSGRAVSRAAAGAWADRLLPCPSVMRQAVHDDTDIDDEIIIALGVTGHFWTYKLAPQMGSHPPPEARARLIDLLMRRQN
jgi:DNA repair protein RecO (recombination protein O)